MDELTDPWYSINWFLPATWSGFTWEHPVFLYLLAAVPFLFLIRWLVRFYFNQKLPVALVKSDVRTSPTTWLRFFPEIIFALALALMLVALARPQRTNEKVIQTSEGIDIMLAIDISQSMQIQDFTPNRLEAAKNVARDFIQGRLQDRIGIVVFSGDAFSLAPLTTDYDLLNAYLNDISFEMIESRGTAIGSAMAVVTNRMRETQSKSKVCILLSDGDNTAGNIDPITAAELAAAYNIKIYTIIVGKEGMVPFGKDYFGRPNMVENTIDETTMRKIAQIGSGQFFRVTDNEALKVVFDRIDQYEKAEINETRFKDTSDYYFIYLRWALALFIFWIFLKSSFMANLLQD
ncbi:MAG: VWA domain-containing protein [Cyclobacteriaceae bacterium]|nr:VWA domain-containing protein [Cyclobacteriaceae bacterium]